ncbi:MAG: hypothetical protein ACXVPC_07555 [Tumebacillaceae bacterium]
MENVNVQAILPHRKPFLFVAEVQELVPGQRAVAVSNLPQEDLVRLGCAAQSVPLWYAAEFLAQTGALAVLAGAPEGDKTLMTGMDGLVLHEHVSVLEPLRAEVELLGEKRGIGKRHGVVWQGERKVAEGLIWYARVRS